jgi:hypothetical protein
LTVCIKNTLTRASRTLLAGGTLGLCLASCTENAPSGPYAQVSPAESEDFFLAAVAHLVGQAKAPARVDPRPLRAGALLHSVSESDLLLSDRETIQLRTAALEARSVQMADATLDWGCVHASGLRAPPPGASRDTAFWARFRAAEPDSMRQRREACLAGGEFVSLAFGPPQEGTDPEYPRRWRIRAMRMMLMGWEVVDLFLERNPVGQWIVVSEQVRVGSFS